MKTPRKKRSPAGGNHRTENRKAFDVPPQYPTAPYAVKHSSSILLCGQCSLFQEGRRKFCAFLGESVRAGDSCILDPLSPAYSWIDSLEVVP